MSREPDETWLDPNDPDPDEPWSNPNAPDRDVRPRARLWNRLGLVALILLAAGAGMAVTISQGHQDSAMLFVGIPTLLALAIALSPPARSVYTLTFKATSVGLLISAIMLHEGAICVLLAAPLVYGVAFGVAAIVTHGDTRAFAVVPLALMLGMEGITPDLRAMPDQTVTATHVVSLAPAEVTRRIAEGPDVAATEPSFPLSNMPLPQHVSGSGIDPGDRWVFHFDGDSHGPGGLLITEVSAASTTATGGQVTFRTVGDTSIVGRWLSWNTAVLEWHAVDASEDAAGVAITLTVHFTRGLDPSWYFGPLQSALVGSAADYLLDTLGLAQP